MKTDKELIEAFEERFGGEDTRYVALVNENLGMTNIHDEMKDFILSQRKADMEAIKDRIVEKGKGEIPYSGIGEESHKMAEAVGYKMALIEVLNILDTLTSNTTEK